MGNPLSIIDVSERTLAVVRGRVAMADIPGKVMPMMDKVWAFIRERGISGFGHNVWLYRATRTGEFDMEVGVQLPEPFEGAGEVVCTATPAGSAVHTFHCGGYHELPGVHSRALAWAAEQGRALSGVSWEVYGDWDDDPAKRRTDIYHLCAARCALRDGPVRPRHG